MSDRHLEQLEREVEASRAKLNGGLSTLRSPSTYSDLRSDVKNDVIDLKDALFDQAKSSVQTTLEGFVEGLKAKAAANPAAALAIGAGIAWRLVQRPPIATALIGAGLYSLFHTPPTRRASRTTAGYLSLAKDRLDEQASEFVESVKQRAIAIGDSAVEKTTELARNVKDRAVAMGEAVSEGTAELVGAASDQGQHWSNEMRRASTRVADVTHTAAHPGRLRHSYPEPSSDARDTLLLGAAGVAVMAALGMALQRRSTESAD